MGSFEIESPTAEMVLPVEIYQSHQTSANQSHAELFSLRDKLVVITGGARGLGISLAKAVLAAGGHVACMDILSEPSYDEWSGLQKICVRSKLQATYHKCDVTNEDDVKEVLASIDASKAAGSTLYGVVTCAGIQQKLPAVEYPVDAFERILKVNVTGTFAVVKAAANIMINNGTKGSIVMVASMSGNIANRGLTCCAYNSSKAAIQQLCRSLAQEWGQHGIRINTLSPGYIRTAMTDALLTTEPKIEEIWMAGALLGRLGAPEDFNAPTVFLLAPGSSFMTGADLRVDGGHTASA